MNKKVKTKSITDYSSVSSTRTTVFFGKTGAGKTSLLNCLFNLNWETDDAISCTNKLTSQTYSPFELSPTQKTQLRIVDSPGIAESELADKSYFPLYAEILSEAQQIIWVFQADTRVYKPDQVAIKKFCPYMKKDIDFIIALNQVDNMHPLDWDLIKNTPSESQQLYIAERVTDVIDHFKKVLPCPIHAVVPCSARYQYRIDVLRSLIINI